MFNNLYKAEDFIVTRWSSPENLLGLPGKGGMTKNSRKGSSSFPIASGEEILLACEENNSGTIRRIWITIWDKSPEMLRGLVLKFYWDNEEAPSIEAPLGLFMGTGTDTIVPFENCLFSSPEGRSFNSIIPMPFRKGMKVSVKNISEKDQAKFFYDIDYTLNDDHDDSVMYLHTFVNHEEKTALTKDFEMLKQTYGQGRFIGSNFYVKVNKEDYYTTWWGEGEVKMYIDDDTNYPTLCGTGVEDYIGTGWGQRKFCNMYQGCPVGNDEKGLFSFFRYHIPDPVYFHKKIRVTVQQIGNLNYIQEKYYMLGKGVKILHADGNNRPVDLTLEYPFDGRGGGKFERQDDWSCCTFYYLKKSNGGK